jgi:hypothetical protein
MGINKTASFKYMLKGIILWVIFFIICLALLYVTKIELPLYSVIIIIFIGWVSSVLNWSRVADLELHDDFFYIVYFFRKTKVNYDGFAIIEVLKGTRTLMFKVYSNLPMLKLAYTKDNYEKIKKILDITKSEYNVEQLEANMGTYAMKPLDK